MPLNATYINYYNLCHRKLWLHANGIRMEHTSDTVYDGKLLHETSYPQRSDKHSEFELFATLQNGLLLSGKIDYYDAKQKVVHETKRSDKAAVAHEWQCKFYLWLLELNGIEDATCVLEFPNQRETTKLILSDTDRGTLTGMVHAAKQLIQQQQCPASIKSSICKSCSYYELCYITEE